MASAPMRRLYVALIPLCLALAGACAKNRNEGASLLDPLPYANGADSPVETWVAVEQPSSDALACASRSMAVARPAISRAEGVVVQSGNGLGAFRGTDRSEAHRVREYCQTNPCPDGVEHAAAIQDGWIVGSDRGEFGGGVWLVGGGRDPTMLWNHRCLGLVGVQGGFVAAVGTDKRWRGALLRLVPEPRKWRVERWVETRGEPTAVLLDGEGGGVVVSAAGLLEFDRLGGVVASARLPLQVLYPETVVRDEDGDLYVGMRHYILLAKRDNDRFRVQWLAPASCSGWSVDSTGEQCLCATQHVR